MNVRFSQWIANAEKVLERDLALREIIFLHNVWLQSTMHRGDAERMIAKVTAILEDGDGRSKPSS